VSVTLGQQPEQRQGDTGTDRRVMPDGTPRLGLTLAPASDVALVCKAAGDRPERSDQPGRKASVSGRSSYSSMPFSSSRLRVLA
jgi:hypothetical protein